MRAVLDTNVFVSALIWGGKPFGLLRAAAAGDLRLATSPALLDELRGVLMRRHLATRLERRRYSVEQAVALYASLSEILDLPKLGAPASRDPDDDAVLALAVAVQADFVASGDEDLLLLGSYVGIPILTPAQALSLLQSCRISSEIATTCSNLARWPFSFSAITSERDRFKST